MMEPDNYLMRIYNLPYSARKALCRLLDLHDKWEELGGMYMNIDVLTLQYFRKKTSPTEELLTHWGMLNHTVLELFVLLSKMQNYQAMMELKPYVNPIYHALIYEGEENFAKLLAAQSVQKNTSDRASHVPSAPVVSGKDLGVGSNNLNVNETANTSLSMKDPLAGILMEEQKILNNGTQNREAHSTAPTVRADNNASPVQPQLSVVNNELVNGGNAARLVSPQQRKLSNVSTASSTAESGTPLIIYAELEAATNGWDRNCILGRGGFGTVYKGTWKNTLVAIKKLEAQKDNAMESMELLEAQRQQSLRELKYLNSCRHDNILPLYGYSVGGDASCLVYQFMINGSLEDRLMCRQGTKPLTWSQRHNIAKGTARGLQFLHSLGVKPLVHGDIKSANILLDPNFEPRIGDFGLAREGPLQQYTHVKVSRVHGTRPYLPDEFLRGKKFSTKVDTFSFGIVLFELATGQRAYEENRSNKFLKDHVEAVPETHLSELSDPKAGLDQFGTASGLLLLGRCCVRLRPKDRPDMIGVLHKLDSMEETRNHIQCAQQRLIQKSLLPSNPYEMQFLYDLSQQRKVTPPSHNGSQKCSLSPNQTPVPGRSNQSPADPVPVYAPLQCNVFHQQQQGMYFPVPSPISPNTPLRNGYHQSPLEQPINHQSPAVRHLIPEETGYPVPIDIHHPPILQNPEINVLAPTGPNFSELLPAQPLEIAMPTMLEPEFSVPPPPSPPEIALPVMLEDSVYSNSENNGYIPPQLTPCEMPLITELYIQPHETTHSNSAELGNKSHETAQSNSAQALSETFSSSAPA